MADSLLSSPWVRREASLAPKILIVDDDEESRSLLREVLETHGYAADAVGDGAEAERTLSGDGGFQIVIADLRMPKQTGLELLRNLKKKKLKQDLILMSSFISARERKLAEELGACALLEKPFRLTELLKVVGEIAAQRPTASSPV